MDFIHLLTTLPFACLSIVQWQAVRVVCNFYLSVLLYGALGSTSYSLGYWGTNPVSYFVGLMTGTEEIGRLERSSTAWRPYIWPIKTIMIAGLFLMLMQALSELVKDVAQALDYDTSELNT